MEYTDLKRKLILMEEDQKCSGFQLFHYEQMLEQEISPEDLIEAAEEIADNWEALSSEKKHEFAEREEMLKQEAFKGKHKASAPKELANQSIQKQLEEIKQSIRKISLAQSKQTPKAKVSEEEKEDKEEKEASNNGEEDCDQIEEPKKQEKGSKQSNLKNQSSSKQGSKQKYRSGCKRRMN